MHAPTVVATEADMRKYLLLTPGVHLPRNTEVILSPSDTDVELICDRCRGSKYLAVDFETRGGDYSADIELIGIGLSGDSGSWYLHWRDLPNSQRSSVAKLLMGHRGLLAHNVYFDAGVADRTIAKGIKWHACTYAMYALLANESQEQRWGLKEAMVDVLGWADSNETELDEWLVGNGYYRGNRRLETDPVKLVEQYHARNARGQRLLLPDKAQMWRAPAPILGKYCVLDAEACYLLYTQILRPTADKFPAFWTYFQEKWMPHIDVHIWQKMEGIQVDRPGLIARSKSLEIDIDSLTREFLLREDVAPHVHKIETALRDVVLTRPPARLKKNGDISKNWLNWEARCRDILEGKNPDYNFNVQSVEQLGKVLYEGLKFPVRVLTPGGQPSAGKKSFIHMGEIGKLLSNRADLLKELSYITKYIELTETRSSIHPSFSIPRPVTGRLSSSEPNMMQIPKSKAVMSLFHAPRGYCFVDIDFAALESVVAAEFSQDPNLLELYRDGAPENDVHLFVASKVPGEMGKAILATGYRPVNPPAGTVARAKKECKHWRSIAKTVVYACQFGAGINKVMQTLEEDDVFLPRDQVAAIHGAYWETFAGLKDFGRSLWYEWRRNKGYIMNGVGRPMAVYEELTKDLLSRFIQSTGHDVLVMYDNILMGLLDEHIPEWKPVIMDLHDATTVAVPERDRTKAMELMLVAMDTLNSELQGTIRMRGVPTSGFTLAEVKEAVE